MSIAILKKKSNTIHGSFHSSKNGGFSLNGTHRNIPYISQSTQSRHFIRTPMKGTEKIGHGGCCGTYNNAQNITPIETNTTENIQVIKPSVINFKGMITLKHRWIKRPYPFSTVKPNNYITSLNTINDVFVCGA